MQMMHQQQRGAAGPCGFSGRGAAELQPRGAHDHHQARRNGSSRQHHRACPWSACSAPSNMRAASRASSCVAEAQFRPLGNAYSGPAGAQQPVGPPQQQQALHPLQLAPSAMTAAGPVASTVGFQPDARQDPLPAPQWQQPAAAPRGSSAAAPPHSPQLPGLEKVGVLLLNLGGPDTLEDVQPFLYNLFADPDIIRLPPPAQFLQPLLAQAISTLRAPKSSEGYKAIGGGSPLRRITEEQADALRAALQAKGVNAEVYVGMRYWHPYTEEALDKIKRDDIGQLVILPLYPQFSISTSGSSLRLLEKLFKEDIELSDLKHTVIPSWYQRKGYVQAMADLIVQELGKFGRPKDVEVFFSAHGVPKSYVEEAGDPYKEEMEECVQLIMDEVARRGYTNHHTLAYQSRVGPVEWLKPYTDDSIRELGARGVKSMLAVPVSFVSEHIETLEEIDMEYRELAEESGIHNWGRVPALNTNEVFISDLADAVIEAMPYVGRLATPNDSLVPMGELEALLQAYDRERRALPSPVVMWEWGWTKSAETWNGRLAMVALFVIVLLEITTGQSIMRSILDIN